MNEEFLDALHQIEKEKEIPFEVLMDTIEQALVHAYKKHSGAMDARVRVDHSSKDFKVYAQKDVVEAVESPDLEITLAQARAFKPDAKIGDTIEFEVTPENFGRIAAQTAKQVVVQRIRDAEREQVYDEFGDRVGEVVTGVVQRTEQRNVIIGLGKVDALLPPPEQVPTEPYNFNDRIKVYVLEVRRTVRGPQVYVSRTHPNLIRGLFELEVPEIAEGIVEIQSVAREPGQRSKIAVSSSDERVDPVGACVGHRGTRVQSVVTELYDEKVDIVRWSPDTARFIAEALSPAKPSNVTIDEESKTALVVMPDNQLSLAIGKSGQNVRLAARLTGWRIDIRSESQADEPAHPGPPSEAAAPTEAAAAEAVEVAVEPETEARLALEEASAEQPETLPQAVEESQASEEADGSSEETPPA